MNKKEREKVLKKYLMKGIAAIGTEQYESGIECFQKIIAVMPRFAVAYL